MVCSHTMGKLLPRTRGSLVFLLPAASALRCGFGTASCFRKLALVLSAGAAPLDASHLLASAEKGPRRWQPRSLSDACDAAFGRASGAADAGAV